MTVYFEPNHKQFFEVKEQRDGVFIISGPSMYYSDSMTNIHRSPVSADFIAGAIKVEAVDAIPDVIYDGIDWRHKDALDWLYGKPQESTQPSSEQVG